MMTTFLIGEVSGRSADLVRAVPLNLGDVNGGDAEPDVGSTPSAAMTIVMTKAAPPAHLNQSLLKGKCIAKALERHRANIFMQHFHPGYSSLRRGVSKGQRADAYV